MAIIEKNIFDKYDGEIALALGYFDSVHNGHCSLIDECKSSGAMPAIFTFCNNPDKVLGKSDTQCFTYRERVEILDKLGVGLVVGAYFDDNFMRMSGEQFLSCIIDNFNIKELVIGADFRCGYMAEFGTREIISYCASRGVKVVAKELLLVGGEKVASRHIKEWIIQGDMLKVNSMLPYPYSVSGVVLSGRQDGSKKVGFPTANIEYPSEKVRLKPGVYASRVIIEDKPYLAITNVGDHPTFEDYHFNIESFVVGFDGDLYGKYVVMEFLEYYRGIKKFDTPKELGEQISYDLERLKASYSK